jgi:hypothetical protein
MVPGRSAEYSVKLSILQGRGIARKEEAFAPKYLAAVNELPLQWPLKQEFGNESIWRISHIRDQEN